MDILYRATATAWGGRAGRVASDDGVLDVSLAVPKAMGGPGGLHTNPEQLFAAGYAACFHSALKFVAREDGLDVEDSAVTARVGIGRHDQNGFGLEVELEVEVAGGDRDVVRDLAERAHRICPYSNATRGNIEVAVRVVS
jgi:Ohr subfamily peroxiredoxin